MAFFTLKISNPESEQLVESILAGSQDFVVEQLNQLEDLLVKGSNVFIQLGGWNAPWSSGLIGLAEIINAPFDQGYDSDYPRNYRIRLKMKVVLDSTITRDDFIPYVNAFNAGGIGPSTRGEQNQAIKVITDNQAFTILRAMVDKQHELEAKFREDFTPDICEAVFGVIPYYVEKSMSYSDYLNQTEGE